MEDVCTCFRRDAGGAWTCVKDCTFEGPNGRVQVSNGQTFKPRAMYMGFNITAWLDSRCGNKRKR